MRSWMKLAFAAFLLAGAGALVNGVGHVMNDATWGRYATPARHFLNAASARDTAALYAQTADRSLVPLILAWQRKEPGVVDRAASSLRTLNGMQTGDTVLVAFAIDDACPNAHEQSRLDFRFIDRRVEQQVAWVRLRRCR
jgi:hypothetical protein